MITNITNMHQRLRIFHTSFAGCRGERTFSRWEHSLLCGGCCRRWSSECGPGNDSTKWANSNLIWDAGGKICIVCSLHEAFEWSAKPWCAEAERFESSMAELANWKSKDQTTKIPDVAWLVCTCKTLLMKIERKRKRDKERERKKEKDKERKRNRKVY